MKQRRGQGKRAPLFLWGTAALLLTASLAFLFPRENRRENVRAEVWIEGKLVMELSLRDTPEGEISLLPYGHAVTLSVRDHAIRFLESDCPDRRCVRNGWLRSAGDQSTCLPNKTSVVLVEEDTVSVSLDD